MATKDMKKPRGFTLIEVMIVVVIIGILASIAYPSYTSYTRNSRRSEAYVALTQLANAQEKFYLNCNSYTASITGAVATCSGLGFASATSSPQGYYGLAAVACAGGTLTTCYTLTATAIGIQAADTACPALSLTSTGTKTPTNCWK